MKNEVLEEILKWSTDRPIWQRDALRRLFTLGKLESSEYDELAELCKGTHGLCPMQKNQPLSEEHTGAIDATVSEPITLISLKHHQGVNALALEQEIKFGPNLNIIFGWNAAGKSGYARILKKMCRSRAAEEILGNVLSGNAPLKAQATVTFQLGRKEISILWNSDIGSTGILGLVSVFDSHCAPVYLGEKTDVAFRPFGLDIFDRLSNVCGEVKKRLEVEKSKLENVVTTFPQFSEGSRVRAVVTALTALTNVDDIKKLATLSKEEKDRLKELRELQRDFQAADPQKHANELKQKAQRIKRLIEYIVKLNDIFAEEKLNSIRSTFKSLKGKQEALVLLRKKVLTPDLLDKTGEEAWRIMWEAAAKFSSEAYPGTDFPDLPKNAHCPLCQQELKEEAIARLTLLKEYITSDIQQEVLSTSITYEKQIRVFNQIEINREDISLVLDELSIDNPELIQKTRDFLRGATDIQKMVQEAFQKDEQLPGCTLSSNTDASLVEIEKRLRDRAEKLLKQNPFADPQIIAEFNDLTDRVSLGEIISVIVGEIERRKRIAAYAQSIEDTATQAITRKSTELTKRLITDQLREAFNNELIELGFTHLDVEIRSAGGARGALYHQLIFHNAPGVSVPGVLSEGESRVLSLAAFFAELCTTTNRSSIIFDDPVSSLDHRWRERIAKRLVKEAANRQVIVFTHDIVFLRALLDEAGKQGVNCEHQYIERDRLGAGVPTASLPWVAARINERIGMLHQKYQEAEKIFRTHGSKAYESFACVIYAQLRETWEQGISEILLADIIERYRPSIETRKVRYLTDISEADCKAVEDGMTECSRWMVGHDEPPVAGTPFPIPDELKSSIDDLESWVDKIRRRRK